MAINALRTNFNTDSTTSIALILDRQKEKQEFKNPIWFMCRLQYKSCRHVADCFENSLPSSIINIDNRQKVEVLCSWLHFIS